MAIIIGTTNDEQLVGTTANDAISGLAGNDQLDGGTGDDTYIFAAGDGFDFILEGTVWGPNGPEAGGTDTVALTTGYDPAMTLLQRWGNDLVIQNGQTGDQIVVREHFGSYLDGSTRAAIERITFGDGTIWNTEAITNRLANNNNNWSTDTGNTIGGYEWDDSINGMGGNDTISGGRGNDYLDGGQEGNDRLFGGEGTDTLHGNSGADLLAGGAGEDYLYGGDGNDVYLFNLGDGIDHINDDVSIRPGEVNTVVFGDGIQFTDLFSYDTYNSTVVYVGGNGDQLILDGPNYDPYAPDSVSLFQFADGTLATFEAVRGYGAYQLGTASNDYLFGTQRADSLYGNGGDDQLYGGSGNDILAGGQGNDNLIGGAGNDTYVFNRGDGMDFIDDYAMSPLEGNRVVFGDGIAVDDLRLRYNGWSSSLEIGSSVGGAPTGTIDILQFSNFFPLDPQAPRSVASFEFADGSVLTVDELIARGFYVGGAEGNDYLFGTNLNERIYGYGGDDTLAGLAGNDTLIGGTGYDQLDGGTGNDKYVFAAGDGFDFIFEGTVWGPNGPEAGGTDTVALTTGYDPAMTQLLRGGNDLIILNGQSGDQIVVREHFGSYVDGNTRSAIELITFADGTIWNTEAINNRIASYNSNMPTEGNDTIGGSSLADYIYTMGGNDTVSGGQGDDQLMGGNGNDSLFGGDGSDVVVGEDGNDVLAGGKGNDILDGGAGNDTYIFNSGDGVDQINDMPAPGETNRVVFGEGIRFQDLSVDFSPGNYYGATIINIGSNGDKLVLNNTFPDPYGPHAVDSFQFADGTVASFDAVIGLGRYQQGSSFSEPLYGSGYADSLYGNGGDDQLYGDYGNDILAGGQGNDRLDGGAGSDTYIFNAGDGEDVIIDFALPNEENRVVFGDGISVNDLRLRSDGFMGHLEIGSSGDTLRFSQFFPWDSAVPSSVTSFTFADGTTLTTNELISAINEAPQVNGWVPDQVVLEDASYGFMLPPGSFVDPNGGPMVYSATLADGSPLPGWLSFDSLTQTLSGVPQNGDVGMLAIRISAIDSLGAAAFTNFNLSVANVNDAPVVVGALVNQTGEEGRAFTYNVPAGTFADVDAVHGDTLTFNATLADGSPLPDWLYFDAATGMFSGTPVDGNAGVLAIAVHATDRVGAIASNTFQLSIANSIQVGTELSDSLYGGTTNDQLYGLGGNDTLYGGWGADVLSGGTGNDFLYGGYDSDGDGSDTYVFHLGDGVDTIFDRAPSVGNIDTIRFGFGITADMLTLAGVNQDLVISINGTGDGVTVKGWFQSDDSNAYRVETLEFADGTEMAIADRTDIANTYTGDASTNFAITGSQVDTLYGLAGDDSLFAGGGNDFVYGGDGADSLRGNEGDDLVDGGAGDDVLHGETGNDTLYGGGGSDILEGDFGNDTLYGGRGTIDTLYGYYGSDTYVFNLGDEQDIIAETFANAGDADTLRFGTGITRDMLDISRSGNNIYIDLPGNDGITLYGWYYSPTYRIENLEFADGTGMTAAEIQAWADNVAPVVATPVATQTATEDALFNFALPAATFSDANVGDVLSYAATLADGSALPGWLQFDAATQGFTGTPDNEQVGTLALRVSATDSYGKSVSTDFNLVVQNTNDAPTVANAIADQTVNEDAAFSFTVPADTFSDVDVGDSLAYSATLADGSALPAWLSFNAATRTFSGTPVNGDVGSVDVLVTALDTGGTTAAEVFTLAVANTNDAPLVVSTIADQAGAEGSAFSYAIPADTFSDVDVGDSLAYSATLADGSALPAWLSFNAATRTLSGNPADGNAGSYSLRVTATDSVGASVFDDFVLTVADIIATVQNGTSAANTLQGTAFIDTLNGLGGNDTLYGYAGNDTLDGGSGSDKMYGGSGDDSYVVNASGDVVTENTNEGLDTIKSSITYTLGSNVENLTLTGSSGISATGNSLNNVLTGNSANNTLTGNAGNDWLDGAAGSDTMRGGSGNDTYVVSTSGDVVTENSNEGTDTVRTSISYTLGNNVENLTLTGAGNASGTGNSLNNVIIGNSASNTLTGNAGNDTLQGLGGNDTLRGGTGNDVYVFGRGDGADTISENDSTSGNLDTANLAVSALDVVIARTGPNLVMSLHGGADTLTVQNWYSGSQYQTEAIKAADGSTLLNTQVDQLIQAMASFTATSGLSWDQAIDQRPQDVQAIVTAYWQPGA